MTCLQCISMCGYGLLFIICIKFFSYNDFIILKLKIPAHRPCSRKVNSLESVTWPESVCFDTDENLLHSLYDYELHNDRNTNTFFFNHQQRIILSLEDFSVSG